ncbi:type I DNA topoisomerase [Candidatus Saccharibacteria bacterium]|nr:type I DNA topoisomerase [Candidatus Saccharibacteria bacterium]
MAKNLVIVESPAKANTIEKYLGSDFKVLSSIGHIRSIATKTKDGKEAIDIKNGFETVYEVDPEKKKTVAELRKAVKAANEVWLATDEDREGEAIAWHLCEVLKLDPKKTKRIVFHEITKSAIEAAVKNPRTVDMQLVQAQQARQILDRIVGFDLSDVVRKKVPGGKSAGRVQSPGVRLLVEREREIEAFEGSFTFKVVAVFTTDKGTLKAELPKRFDTEAAAQKFLESLTNASFTVSDITTSPSTRNPGAPFTTSTLQQDANSRLGFSAKATMSAAQKLYQEGKITYMRTDSVNLSGTALSQMTKYIESQYGKEYHQIRTFKTKSSGAQEAHEAIRPTDVSTEVASSDAYNQKLYDLIRRRTLASQMAPAKLEKTTITITISGAKEVFEAKGEVIIFDGFLKVYGGSKKDAEILPAVTAQDNLKLTTAEAKQVFARPPARYSEGSLVKKLEELGIGRPSTYATIINTVQARGYAEKGESEGTPREVIVLSLENGTVNRAVVEEKTGSDRGKLVPTASGMVMSDFLTNHFNPIVDYGFTAHVEEDFDQIAEGKLERNKMLMGFYTPFQELIEKSGGIDRSTVAQAREIGIDPKTQKPVLARFGRYGPMLQLGATDSDDKEDKPRFAPLPKGAKIETVTLDQALEMFKLPRVVGTTEQGEEIKANIGRFGPYIQVGKLYVSLKEDDPLDVTEEKARTLYAEKLKAEAEKNIADFGTIKVLKGRYGPYITDGKKNAKIPKEQDPAKLTEAECKKLLADAPTKGKGRRFTRKK